jgi:hypothetical protein
LRRISRYRLCSVLTLNARYGCLPAELRAGVDFPSPRGVDKVFELVICVALLMVIGTYHFLPLRSSGIVASGLTGWLLWPTMSHNWTVFGIRTANSYSSASFLTRATPTHHQDTLNCRDLGRLLTKTLDLTGFGSSLASLRWGSPFALSRVVLQDGKQ